MATSTRKVGRKRKNYVTSWDETINGLTRRTDGRWRCITCGYRWTEPDERRAVAQFHRHDADTHQRGSKVHFRTFAADAPKAAKQDRRVGVHHHLPESELWEWMRRKLIENPELCASKTAIPELARLADLPKPKPSPTLADAGKLYVEKAQITEKERRESETFWREFRRAMESSGILTLRKLTADAVAAYGDEVQGRGKSPTYVRHRFGKIKSVINFARKRGLHPDDCRHALDCCAVLILPKSAATDPKPIERADFRKMLQKSSPRMRAAMLLMLNGAMYPSEALAVDWDEVDLEKKTLRTRRSKTGVVRIAILWPETVKSLVALGPMESGPIIRSRYGSRLSVCSLADDWRPLRKSVGCSPTMDQCRDGAYTAAVEAGVDVNQAKLLSGHATGISDAYVLRRPHMVAEACDAIHQHYLR